MYWIIEVGSIVTTGATGFYIYDVYPHKYKKKKKSMIGSYANFIDISLQSICIVIFKDNEYGKR